MLFSILIKGVLKHHTYGDFEQHRREILQINIGLGSKKKNQKKTKKKTQITKCCKIMGQSRSRKLK